jgi:TP901 family phage tail tape measure protein
MTMVGTRNIEIALRLNIGDYQAKLGAAGAQTKAFARDLDKASTESPKSLEKIGTAGLVMGGVVGAGFALAVHAAVGFDKQMSAVQGATRATAEQVGGLRDAALDAGAATIYSASEAAKAQEELAKAGVSVADILNGGLTGALDLAAAGNLELGRAAEIAANAMTTFSLSGSDVPMIADTLAAAAGKSAAGVEDMAQAMQQSGLVASQMGLDVDDTAGALALFAQNGLKGSDAGTSFKTALMRLVPQTEAQATAMADLGLEFFDAQGNFIGLEATAEQLQNRLGGLSQEQRLAAETTIFGSDAIRAAEILYRAGGEGVAEWTEKVNDAGYAAELAAIRSDNLAGDLEQLKGALETALIQGGGLATEALRKMAQGLTDVVTGLGEMPAPLQAAFLGSTGLLGVGASAIGIYGTLKPKLDEVKKSLNDMGSAGQSVAANMGKIAKVGAVSVLVLAEVAQMFDAVADGAKDADAILASVNYDSGSVDSMNAALGALGQRQQELFDRHRNQRDGILDMASAFADVVIPIHNVEGSLIDTKAAIDALDPEMAKLRMNTVHLEEVSNGVARSLGITADEAERLVIASKVDVNLLPFQDAVAAVEAYKFSLGGAPPVVLDMSNAIAGLGDDTKSAEEKLKDFNDSLKAFLDIAFGEQEAADAITRKMNDLAEAAKNGKLAFQGNSDAALDFRDRMRDITDSAGEQITTWAELGIQGEDLKVKVYLLSQSLIDQATKMGIPRKAAEEYFGKLNEIPSQVFTDLWADTAGTGAQANVDALAGVLDRIDRGAYAVITVDTKTAEGQVDAFRERLRNPDHTYQYDDAGNVVLAPPKVQVGDLTLDGRQVYGLDQQWHPVPGRASGGPVDPWSAYRVHDSRSPELLSLNDGTSMLFTGAAGGQVTNLGDQPYRRMAETRRATSVTQMSNSSTSNVTTIDRSVHLGDSYITAPDGRTAAAELIYEARKAALLGLGA